MPELPEVEVTRRSVAGGLLGARVLDVRMGLPLRWPLGHDTQALAGTVWSDGCQSYFKNANGKIATQLPQTSRWYAQRTRRFRMKEYVRS